MKNNKSEKYSPTILWEMAQSPYCGPAAISCPISFTAPQIEPTLASS